MDKLEEIKALRNNAGFYENITVHEKATEQVDWLIAEIERLGDLLERALPRLYGVSNAFRREIKQALKESK